MERRDFLKLSCTGCLLGAAGLISMTELLESCGTAKGGTSVYKTNVTDKKVTVPLAQFASNNLAIVRAKGIDYDIAVRKMEDGQYEALLLCCTHFSNPLIVAGDHYQCNVHGSEFDAKGKVRKGPAAKPLKQYAVTTSSDAVIISV